MYGTPEKRQVLSKMGIIETVVIGATGNSNPTGVGQGNEVRLPDDLRWMRGTGFQTSVGRVVQLAFARSRVLCPSRRERIY